jgi:formate hydrogenlyase subunit 6/NADH:ubiquinone oxidoreductase subunit I
MPQWFIRGLRRGVVTTRYPARPEPSARDLPRPPAFRPAVLTRRAADALVQICPSRALARSEDTLVFDVGACTACGWCREHSPEAVASSGEFELATPTRRALVKRIPLLADGEVSP